MNLFSKEYNFHVIVENHKVSEADVLFHLKDEYCRSAHKHKVGLDDSCFGGEATLKATMQEMKSMAEGLTRGT